MAKNGGNQPRGYRVQEHVECCANCMFCEDLAEPKSAEYLFACEIHGEPSDADYHRIGTHPLGLCDAFKFRRKK